MIGLGQSVSPATLQSIQSMAPAVIDCTEFWDYMIHPSCAEASPNWLELQGASALYGNYPSPPTPQLNLAPPQGIWTTPPANGQQAQGVIDQILTQNAQSIQAGNQNFFSQLAGSLPAPSPVLNWGLALAIGAVIYFISNK